MQNSKPLSTASMSAWTNGSVQDVVTCHSLHTVTTKRYGVSFDTTAALQEIHQAMDLGGSTATQSLPRRFMLPSGDAAACHGTIRVGNGSKTDADSSRFKAPCGGHRPPFGHGSSSPTNCRSYSCGDLNLWSPVSGLSLSWAGSALSPLGTFRLQDAGSELGMMPQSEKMMISPPLEVQAATSHDYCMNQDDTCETFGPQTLVAAREHGFPLQSRQSQWLTPERNAQVSRDSSTESRHDGCSSNSSNDEPRRIRLHTWAEDWALHPLPEAVLDRAQLQAATQKVKGLSKGSVTNTSGDQQNLSTNNLQRTKEVASAGSGMPSPEGRKGIQRLVFVPTPLRKRRTEEAIPEADEHAQPGGSGSGAGTTESRNGYAFQESATRACQQTETVPQAVPAASSSSIDASHPSLSPERLAVDREDTKRLPSPGVKTLSASSDEQVGICSCTHSRVCMFNIGTPRESAPQTPTGNRVSSVSYQENMFGSLEGNTEVRVGKSPASSSQCRKTRWSRDLPIASCDPCQSLDCATALSPCENLDCSRSNRSSHSTHSSHSTYLPVGKIGRWRNRGSSAFEASVQWAATAEEFSSPKQSALPMDNSNTLPMSNMPPTVIACGREIEALQEDLAQRAKRFTEHLRSCGTAAAAMDGGSASSVDAEFVEEAKRLECVISHLLMAANAREGRCSQDGQQPRRAHSAPQLRGQDASIFNERFGALVAGSPLPFCAPSTEAVCPVSNAETKTYASGSADVERRATKVDIPWSWDSWSSCAHKSPRTPQKPPLHDQASSTYASPMFGTNMMPQSMSPTCSGPRSKVEVTLLEQQWSEDWVATLRHESRKRRWGGKPNRLT